MTPAQPPRPALRALTGAELKAYRQHLERTTAFFDKQDPVPPVRANLQAALDRVITEQDDRKRIASA